MGDFISRPPVLKEEEVSSSEEEVKAAPRKVVRKTAERDPEKI